MEKKMVKISSLTIKFDVLLSLVNGAMKKGLPLKITRSLYNQKTTNAKFIRWLDHHKIVRFIIDEMSTIRKSSLRSRKSKIEISFQLKALGTSIKEISQIFGVRPTTVQGYFKEIGKHDARYLSVLSLFLKSKNLTKKSDISSFGTFPLRIQMNVLKKKLNSTDINMLNAYIEDNKYLKITAGQELGTSVLSILFPKES